MRDWKDYFEAKKELSRKLAEMINTEFSKFQVEHECRITQIGFGLETYTHEELISDLSDIYIETNLPDENEACFLPFKPADENPMKDVENACINYRKTKKAYHDLFFETLKKQAIEHNLPPEKLIKIYLVVLLEKVNEQENINANEILKIAIKEALGRRWSK